MADEVIKKLKQHDEQLEIIASTVLDNKERLDKITDVVVDNQEQLDKMDQKMDNFVTKEDHQEVMGALDTIIRLAKKKDEELTFMGENVKRNTESIEKIKPLVGLESS